MSGSQTLPAPRAHQLALLLESRCRRCAERLPAGAVLRAVACPLCGEPILPTEAERALLTASLAERTTSRFWTVAAVAAGGTLLVGWFPLLSSLVLAGCLVWISAAIVRPSIRMLSPVRRLVTRWSLRLAAAVYLAFSLILIEALTLLPIAGVAIKAAGMFGQVAFAGYFAHTYLGWQLAREARRAPIATGEYLLLAFATVAVLGGCVAVVAFVGWLSAKAAWLQALILGGAP
jgi:hypothetical protein